MVVFGVKAVTALTALLVERRKDGHKWTRTTDPYDVNVVL